MNNKFGNKCLRNTDGYDRMPFKILLKPQRSSGLYQINKQMKSKINFLISVRRWLEIKENYLNKENLEQARTMIYIICKYNNDKSITRVTAVNNTNYINIIVQINASLANEYFVRTDATFLDSNDETSISTDSGNFTNSHSYLVNMYSDKDDDEESMEPKNVLSDKNNEASEEEK